jgi:hypothetical protein
MKLINNIMAKLSMRRVVPTPEDVAQGIAPMSKEEILELMADYKRQNPAKYEAKKEAMFAKYGLKASDEPVDPEPDENDKELAELKAKAKKK